MTAARRATSTFACAVAVIGLAGCGDDDGPPRTGAGPRGPVTTASTGPIGPADGRPFASAAASGPVARSLGSVRARTARGPVLLGPPLIVLEDTSLGTDEGPAIGYAIRFRLGKRVPLRRNGPGLDRGGVTGRTRGRVVLTDLRSSPGDPFRAVRGMDLSDTHGFTPDSRGLERGFCYGASDALALRAGPDVRRLAAIPSGAPMTVRISITSKGGGTTVWDVPGYDARDTRIPAAAREAGCAWP